MRSLGRTIIMLALMLLAVESAVGAQISIGIRIGPPPEPRVIRVQPPRPDSDFVWVDGYWYPVGRRYTWHDGYWTRPPYEGARWVGPHHDGEQFFLGYWSGDRGRIEHDHHWDRKRDRDDRRDRDRDDRRGRDRDDRRDRDREDRPEDR